MQQPTRSISAPGPLTDEYRWNLLQQKTQTLRAVRAFELFRENGIEPVLIKGLAAGRYYPAERPRIATDTDLAVSCADFAAADIIARSDAATGLAIDLHRELRHLDTVGWGNLYESSQLITAEGGTIRVLRPEDHLRIVCVHWLTDGGSNKERLWDVFYMVANRPPGFDWDRFVNLVDERRRRWLICTVGLAKRYLGLDLTGTPIEAEASDLPAWLIKAVEREWASETRTWPLEASINDPKLFIKQIGKRLRPNPIRATVQSEGSFDASTRVFYQLENTLKSIVPSIRRIFSTIRIWSK